MNGGKHSTLETKSASIRLTKAAVDENISPFGGLPTGMQGDKWLELLGNL